MNSVLIFGLPYFCFICPCHIGFRIVGVKKQKGEEKSAEDYFLASKSLSWWAIGLL